MEEEYRGRPFKEGVYIYWFTVIVITALGIYYTFAGKFIRGIVYGRFRGPVEVSYTGPDYLILAAALLLIGLLVIYKGKSKNKNPH